MTEAANAFMKPIAKTRSGKCLAILIASAWYATPASADDPAAMNAAMESDGRTFTVAVPGVVAFQAGFSATVEIDGKLQVLSSDSGPELTLTERLTEATPYGSAEVTTATFFFENVRIDLLFRLGIVPGVTGVLAQAGIRNAGNKAVKLLSVTPATLAGQVVGNPQDWLVTALDESSLPAAKRSTVALSDLREPLTVNEYGSLYRRDGAGFFFGPVGAPIAFAEARFAPRHDGRILLNLTADMSGVPVDPGETRWGQQVVLLMEPPRAALARWAQWVGQTHGARTDKGALSGWSDSNSGSKKDTSKELLDVVDAVQRSGGRLRPHVIQTEDNNRGVLNAPWLPMCAQRISEAGARLGLRLVFDIKTNPVEPSFPWNIIMITQTVHRAVQSGFNYLKISYPPGYELATGEKRTDFEVYRDNWAAIRKAAGKDAYLLFCDRSPNRAVAGIVDASRIGAASGRGELRTAMSDVLRSYHLHGRWFVVDDDVYYMGTQIANIGGIPGGWPVVRTWISMVGLSCGAAITSDPWYQDGLRPYWRNVEVLTPPAGERTEVLDLCTDSNWPRLVGHVTRDWGDWTVALLWNPGATENSTRLDFASAGLDPRRRYAVWSFWDNRYLGVANGSWTTPPLPPSGSQHLRFTDLDRTPNRPVVIGSSLHIYCGAAEIKRVTSLTDAIEIELTDAGARAGDLFVYSRLQPVPNDVTGCVVKNVSSAGENVWRISLAGRKAGVPQRVELGIMLPVTRQPWFWLLIAAACASLLFAAWRYVAGLRIQREHALAKERARIAQDLHDDLGGELSSIAMLSDLAQHHAAENEAVRARLREISIHSRDTVRRLEEIVWAINPANDNIERFAGYFCKFVQGYLELAGVRSRFDVPDQLPARPLTSVQRHNLFLAAKEALHNAVRHGKPGEVTIRIALRGESLVVTIEDNGAGFVDTPTLSAARGSGNMEARMKQIGGTFERHSTPGLGTVVVLSAPLMGM